MPQTTAERQKAYRAKRPFAGDNGERRLSIWLTTAAALAIERTGAVTELKAEEG